MRSYTDVMKPEDISVAAIWATFAGLVIPTAPAYQREAMREAFYAGFTECFKIINDLSVELPEGKAANTLAKISREANEYVDTMLKKYMTKVKP